MRDDSDKFTDTSVNVLYIEYCVTRNHFAAGFGSLVIVVAGHIGTAEVPVIGQE